LKQTLFKIVGLALVLTAACPAGAADIMVFAAASLTDSLRAIRTSYESNATDHIDFNFAGSSTLARQIAEGAPADIFFSADEAKMDGLAAKGLIDPDTRQSRLGNSLVVVVPADSSLTVRAAADLTQPQVERIALADPQAVPAGIYAKAWLQKSGLWSALQSRVVPTENVRAALAAVESGNVEAGVVYKTDAAISHKVKVAYVVPVADAPDISYPVALIKDAPEPAAARKFMAYLASPAAAKIFVQFGFTLRQ
jgi:molybdate transport system substrate-binding protein